MARWHAPVRKKFAFIVLPLFLLAMVALACVAGCPKTFTDNSKLTKHKRTCQHVKELRTRSREVRKEQGHVNAWKDITSLPDRKQRLQAALSASSAAQSSVQAGSSAPDNEHSAMQIDMEIEALPPPDCPDPIQLDDVPNAPPVIPAPQPLTRSGRPRRNYQLPRRFRDIPPDPTPCIPDPPVDEAPAQLPRVLLIVRDRLVTMANAFGLVRDYPRRPTRDPDASLSLDDLAASPLSMPEAPKTPSNDSPRPSYWPFANMTVQRVMQWLNNGVTTKSEAQMDEFVEKVILAPGFKPEDLTSFSAHRENSRLDKELAQSSDLRRQFMESSVEILVPSGDSNVPAKPFTIPGLFHRKLTSVILEAFESSLSHLYHFSPFKLFHESPITKEQERVFGEIYTSDAFVKTHEDVQRHGELPPDSPDCKLEKVVAALMFSSDATHLTTFGNAKAWPIYLMLGNLSKYFRAKPNSGAMHHLAYIPSLPDSFQDFASAFHSKWRSQKQQILTHCRRELMQRVWEKLLDDDFIHAYKYGIVIKCIDGVERRVYPRLFTYSADYPEKVLLATIRDKGLCPCPRCLVLKSNLDKLGLRRDAAMRVNGFRNYLADKVAAARRAIYELAKPITGVAVENLLKAFSGVPTTNAFAERLGSDFNPSTMLVVDLLHEFELGVWKTLFTHLIRLLYAAGHGSDELVLELDRRYREISTFGNGTIRTFSNNSSEMKKLAARDFEDLLQCSIPAFEGLLEGSHNRRLMKLLYRTAEWHGLAKMRIHTESSLALLEELTTEFGQLMRQFRDLTCSQFATTELPKEVIARNRRQGQKQTPSAEPLTPRPHIDPTSTSGATIPAVNQAQGPPLTSNVNDVTDPQVPPSIIEPRPTSSTINSASSTGRRPKLLNLATVKFHFLGDYVRHIRLFGTTDSYSTQLGELAHRLVKRFYGLTNKKGAIKQISKKYSRMQALNSEEQQEVLEAAKDQQLAKHHIISKSRNTHENIYSFVLKNGQDPAKKDFIPKLQDHLLGRILQREFDGDTHEAFTNEDRNSIRIQNGRVFRHQTVRINYTTYDMRRAYDTINPRTHPFVMVASPESGPNAHPFWYAAVLGVFHAEVQHTGPRSRDFRSRQMEFLWVRWLGVVPNQSFSRKHARLPKIGFIKESDEYAFGFLDPALVLRGCHLIPSFVDGRTNDLLSTRSPTEARSQGQVDDWANYYVGIFVDRDMLSRFLGTGIGHKGQTNQHESRSEDQDDASMDVDSDSITLQEDDQDDGAALEGSEVHVVVASSEDGGEDDGQDEENEDEDENEESPATDEEDEDDLGYDEL